MNVPLNVLLVEDSPADAELVLIELRGGGYEPIYERIDTPEAMKAALEKGNWDIILSDYMMPRFSGPAALKLVQESSLDLPFVMVTGQVGEETAVETMKAGANDYVLKGNLTRLVPAIQRELRDAQTRQERKRIEEALRESEMLYRGLFQTAGAGVVVLDAEGRIAEANERAQELLGLSLDQMKGRTSLDPRWAITREDGSPFPDGEDPTALAQRTGQAVRDVVVGVFHADGSRRWMLASAAPILSSATGKPTGAVATFVDITERKRIEGELLEAREELETRVQERTQELGEQRNLLHMVVENAPAGIAVLRGYDLVYEMVNSVYQLFAPGKQMHDRTFAEVWPEAAEMQVPLLRKVLDTGEPFFAKDLLIPIRRSPDGLLEDRYWTYAYLRLSPGQTGEPGILSWVTETTEQLRHSELNP